MLSVDNCLLPIPPEIVKRQNEPKAILSYYFQNQFGETKPLNEAKVLLVGQPCVGKTSIVNRLLYNNFNPNESATQGIQIGRWPVVINTEDIRLNLWDFGGQEIMHETHRLFFTKRSLYLLVLDARQEDNENRIEYWLNEMHGYAEDSPIIIVANKCDERPLNIDKQALRIKHSSLKAVVEISCKDNKGFDILRKTLLAEVSRLKHIHDSLLVSWFRVKMNLEVMKEDYISYDQYVDMCYKEGITDANSQGILLSFLHDLGIIICFRKHADLKHTFIHNPQWITSGIYSILNSNDLFQKKGVLSRNLASQILASKKYPEEKVDFIIRMMIEFKLCFELIGGEEPRFLIPDLLHKEEPDTGNWEGSFNFGYHYNISANVLFLKFMTNPNIFSSISKDTYWKNGLILAKDDCKALVKVDLSGARISVHINGPKEKRKRLADKINDTFKAVHSYRINIQAKTWIALPGTQEKPMLDDLIQLMLDRCIKPELQIIDFLNEYSFLLPEFFTTNRNFCFEIIKTI